MKLYIKYMVSLRCKMLVKEELKKLGIDQATIDLGMVEVDGQMTEDKKEIFSKRLKEAGLEILNDEKNILVEKIINVIEEMIHSDEALYINDSEYISKKLGYGYNYLSQTFSEVKGVTIQQYIIAQKIEAVKEYLLYDELTLTEIAHNLNYSSVAHLSNQFKKVTGLTPTYFKLLKTRNG